ncbi:type II toxin-antitoxin system RelE/ParE family toxin [Clostridium sp. MCC353]|uniref:type II toxin-antitoxin system RelE/ParE family toxin n=1 Tax=Clostridium sp. MCC353 TaxID=2592646 RepID=UPI001C029362|nr:type II toxin-antitoxin system RelE/ParE family toxin [Clostridium sp. MCC353]MBT9779388.1 type II toxin-antitoxin system RelE/ParE family toxin [Clostridium sp. MCC353]
MEERKNYKIRLTPEARSDIAEIKKYILTTFKYRETAEDFSKKMKHSISKLSPFSEAYAKTGLSIQNFEVYYKPYSTYLIFFVVQEDKVIVIRILKDRMYWQPIIKRIRCIE